MQGGTKTHHHLDGLLMGLGVELGERPLLVHRLDRDTSGVIVIAKRRAMASALGKLFATRAVKKTYWAVVKGVPKPAQGRIEVALIKAKGPDGDRMRAAPRGRRGGRAARRDALCRHRQGAAGGCLGVAEARHRTPAPAARPHGAYRHPDPGRREVWWRLDDLPEGVADRSCTCMRGASSSRIRASGTVDVSAPLPDHMRDTFALFGFDADRFEEDDTVRLAIFDVDGTLVDSRSMIAAALTARLRRSRPRRAGPDRMLSIVGLSLVDAMAALDAG